MFRRKEKMKFIKREVLKQKPDFSNLVFGKNISDYMLECDYADGKWGEPVIKPVEDFALSPATMIFHYGQGRDASASKTRRAKSRFSVSVTTSTA